MSLRFSIEEALNKGWISKAEAERQRAADRVGLNIQHDGRRGQLSKQGLAPTPQATGKPSEGKQGDKKPERLVCSLDGDLPQEKLWRACVRRWPEKVAAGELVWELQGAVPGRRYRLDIGFPRERLACEVDGWEFHGKYLDDFKRDRARDRQLVIHGWRVVRFYAEEIHSDAEALVSEIEKALSAAIAGQK